MFRFFTGTIKFRIKSSGAESVINRLRHEIPINDIYKPDKDTLEFTTGYAYRTNVLTVVKQWGAETETVYAKGLPVLFDKYKRRYGFLLGLLLSVLAVWISSSMIWELRISGNTYVPSKEIANNLKSLGVSEGRFIDKEILETVYNSFLIKEPRISWISVNFDGTVAKVEVKETEIVPEKIDRNKNINIVAKCDGVIRRMDVFDGKSEVVSGEPVTKGQLLVSSFTETRKTGVFMKAARGNAWATTVHNFEICISKESYEKDVQATNREISILILGIRIPLNIAVRDSYENKDADFVNERYMLFDKFPMPFVTETKYETKYITRRSNLSENEAKEKADKELEHRIETELSDAEIVKKTQSMAETETEYVFNYELICYENIASSKEFEFQ